MRTDRELLELAAKAVGYTIELWGSPDYYSEREGEVAQVAGLGEWNPLTDDGDALRLAVTLEMLIDVTKGEAVGHCYEIRVKEPHNTDPYAATRRAIVRAAAQIGEMK